MNDDSIRRFDFTDEELLCRLGNCEDHYVERKSAGDKKDWLKTAVAFANAVPVNYPAILFVGVKNDGTIEGQANLDSLEKTFSETMNHAYPPIYYTPRIVSREGKQCLAMIIPGSALRPHFAGPAYVRGFDKQESVRDGICEVNFPTEQQSVRSLKVSRRTGYGPISSYRTDA